MAPLKEMLKARAQLLLIGRGLHEPTLAGQFQVFSDDIKSGALLEELVVSCVHRNDDPFLGKDPDILSEHTVEENFTSDATDPDLIAVIEIA